MFNRSQRSLMAGFIALALLVAMLMPATFALARPLGQEPQKAEGQDKKKKEEKPKDEKPKVSKEEKEYQKIKRFSLDQYMKDPDFRDAVDDAYLQKQREHSEYAYFINTRDSSDDQITHTGDKLKVEDTLYDNPLAQDYVNRVGQSLVPGSSTRLYAFKITLNPIPESRALSTGTVYVSSGLLSSIDNEAQLAYVLGHEIAHIEKEHWKEDVLVAQGVQAYNENQQKKRARIGAIINIATSAIGVAGGGVANAYYATQLAVQYAPSVIKLLVRDSTVSWDRLQEDEADQLSLKYMLDHNYDVREVPKFYASLRGASQRDTRARLGFMAEPDRVTERLELVNQAINTFSGSFQRTLYVGAINLADRRLNKAVSSTTSQSNDKEPDKGKTLDPLRNAAGRAEAAEKTISGALAPDVQAKLDAGELIGTSAEFEAVMAGLKRDNGVRAYYFDMFQMARDNLEESLAIRSNDPYTHFYYGKVLKLTARSMTEKSRALGEFARAIELDKRRVLPESHLYRALSMIESKDPAQTRDIVASLKEYVSLYQRGHAGDLPPNMEVIYDYMQEAGEMAWSATPAVNVSTKNIEPIGVSSAAGARPAVTTPASNTEAAPDNSAKPARGNRRP
ncbi:MAG: M48 family metallopeptidase [Pyrinomonadaceae bacterium]